MRTILSLMLGTLLIAGCHDDRVVAPRPLAQPAAPRGVYSVTGDHEVFLSWLANTEPDVAGYRIYQAPCASGSSCPYDRIGSTPTTTFTAGGLANGVTRYYAVAAYDFAGNESALTYETLSDTPRPEGFAARLSSYLTQPATAGWDFSAALLRPWDHQATDMFYGSNGSLLQMFVLDYQTDIQDAGYASSLDAVDFAPGVGWSPTGSVEVIEGHCYVVWTRDNHYAKFRVTSIITPPQGSPIIEFDWAYQVATGNRELRAQPAREEGTTRRPITWLP